MSTRNSNVEFLRIIAMFMILMLHANYFTIGVPTNEDVIQAPINSFFRVFFEMFAICGVNIFVLISGWFGIHANAKGCMKFLFQCLFIVCGVYIVGLLFGKASLNLRQIAECFFLTSSITWFIKAYLGLYLFSPFLNLFCENARKKLLGTAVIIFYIYQTIGGVLTNAAPIFFEGCSATSFIGLYLLARYMKMYGQRLYRYSYLVYLGSLIGLIGTSYLGIILNIRQVTLISLDYANPLIVLNALSILILATKRPSSYNSIINFIASSSFAVYLIHCCNSWTVTEYRRLCKELYCNYSGCEYLLIITMFMTIVFILAIFIDQIRLFCWNRILQCYTYRKSHLLKR